MTKAEEIRNEIKQVLDGGNSELIAWYAHSFYQRVYNQGFQLLDIKRVAKRYTQLRICHYQHGGMVVEYDEQRNTWRIDNIVYSDSDIAELLGVPTQYLDGLTDLSDIVWSRIESSIEALEEAEEKSKILDARIAELEADREKLRAEICRVIESRSSQLQGKKFKDFAKTYLANVEKSTNLDGRKIPKPEFPLNATTVRKIPMASGIYFLWSVQGQIVYVGQSIHLQQRLRNHPMANPGELVSWVLESTENLNYTEAYYIGVCRPVRNFGGSKMAGTGVSELLGA